MSLLLIRTSFSFLFSIVRSCIGGELLCGWFRGICISILRFWAFVRNRRWVARRIPDPPFWTFRTQRCSAWWSLKNSWSPWQVAFLAHVSCLRRVLLVDAIHASIFNFRRRGLDSDGVGYWSWTLVPNRRRLCDWLHLLSWSACSQTQSSACVHYPGRARTSPSLIWISCVHFQAWIRLHLGYDPRCWGLCGERGTAIGVAETFGDVGVAHSCIGVRVVVVGGKVVVPVVHAFSNGCDRIIVGDYNCGIEGRL